MNASILIIAIPAAILLAVVLIAAARRVDDMPNDAEPEVTPEPEPSDFANFWHAADPEPEPEIVGDYPNLPPMVLAFDDDGRLQPNPPQGR
jgi:hypothetical protein